MAGGENRSVEYRQGKLPTLPEKLLQFAIYGTPLISGFRDKRSWEGYKRALRMCWISLTSIRNSVNLSG